ncbi:MAG: DNA-binding protein [Proteobacteria bacterium]|nr:DNA-binding protein [Pseudomonadota bacterium]
MKKSKRRLLTVRELCTEHPWPSESGLRWLNFNAKDNGLAGCIIRIGRRVLIDEKSFLVWAEQHREEL